LKQFIKTGVSIEYICLDPLTPEEGEVLKAKQILYSPLLG